MSSIKLPVSKRGGEAIASKQMTISDKREVKSNGAIIAVLLLFLLTTIILQKVTYSELDARRQEYESYTNTYASYEKKTKEVENLIATVESGGIPNSTRELITQKEFVDFAGETCERYDLQLNKLTGGRIINETGRSSIDFAIEVQGRTENVQKFLLALNNLPAVATIKSASYRNDANQEWMQRVTDEKKLLEWWSLKTEEKKSNTSDENATMDVATMMAANDMKLYLNIQFVKLA